MRNANDGRGRLPLDGPAGGGSAGCLDFDHCRRPDRCRRRCRTGASAAATSGGMTGLDGSAVVDSGDAARRSHRARGAEKLDGGKPGKNTRSPPRPSSRPASPEPRARRKVCTSRSAPRAHPAVREMACSSPSPTLSSRCPGGGGGGAASPARDRSSTPGRQSAPRGGRRRGVGQRVEAVQFEQFQLLRRHPDRRRQRRDVQEPCFSLAPLAATFVPRGGFALAGAAVSPMAPSLIEGAARKVARLPRFREAIAQLPAEVGGAR